MNTEPTSVSPRGILGTVLAGIAAALAASACCIGPLALVSLGLGGAGLFIRFEPYRPYFMGAALVLLGFAFYRSYRKQEREACDCDASGRHRRARWALWAGALGIMLLLGFPQLLSLFL